MLALHQSDGSLSLHLSLHSQKGKLIVGGWWGQRALHLPPCGYLFLWQVISLREKNPETADTVLWAWFQLQPERTQTIIRESGRPWRGDSLHGKSFQHKRIWEVIQRHWGFPSGEVVKNPPANAGDTGDLGLIPGSGRSPEAGNGNPLQYSSLENPMDRGAWWAIVHRITKSRTWLGNWTQSTRRWAN